MANPVSPTANEGTEEEEEAQLELDPQTIAFLKTCNASGLSKQLSRHRFVNRPSEVTVFLQEAYRHAEKVALEDAMTQPNDASVDFEDSTSSSPTGTSATNMLFLSEPLETSLLTPRMGKVKIQLSPNGGLLATRINMSNTSQQQHLHVPKGSVSHLIVFPKPEDCKLIKNKNKNKNRNSNHLLKVKGHVVLLKLKETVPFQGKEVDQLCFALPWNKTDGCTGPKLVVDKQKKKKKKKQENTGSASSNGNGSDSDDDDDSGNSDSDSDDDDGSDDGAPAWKMAADGWRKVLTQALQPSQPTSSNSDENEDDNDNDEEEHEENAPPQMKVTQVRVNSTVFTSHIEMGTSTTTSGMPFVSCNRGVQDGVLYPLKQGLLFFKPPRFLPVSDMQEIMFGRGASAGQSSSRYVDLAIVLKPKQDEDGNDKLLPKDQIEEFSNILCQEEGALQDYNGEYILPYLQKKKKKKENSSSNNGSSDEDDTDDAEEVQAVAEDTDDDTDADDEDFDEAEVLEEEGETDDDDETDDEDEGGIPMGTDEWVNELRKEAEQNPKRYSPSDESEEDDSVSDERTKRRMSKRFKR
ncbi:MAG: hypothetical protein SGBAC_007274 [Bacillariaceae sp.]